jgi:phosphoglycerol transferase MdoB-like AlkP superfamily enzyme
MQKALLESRNHDKTPAFVYVHLMMPHVPYVYDSIGRLKSSFEHKPLVRQEADSEYLQYLVYTNRRISQFIEELQKSTNNNAILMLMSDHGYRDASHRDYKLAYQTFSAVYVPGQIYDGWYDGMSNVNQYRVLFNSVFGQNFSVLKDSLVRNVNDSTNKLK